MLKAVIGSIRTDECVGIVECTGRACTCLVVEERVICNFEEPRAEMPAVLVELGFITNPSDARLMVDEPELFAQGVYNGTVEYLNLN